MQSPLLRNLAAILKAEVPYIKVSQRKQVVRHIRELMSQSLELEQHRQNCRPLAKETRQILPLFRKTLTGIRNAEKGVSKSLSVWKFGERTSRPDWVVALEGANAQLNEARSSLEFHMNQHSLKIHPRLKRAHEQLNPAHPAWNLLIGGHDYPLDHLRNSAVNHWLVCRLNTLLSPTVKAVGTRHRLICSILEASGEAGWLPERVKTILDRESKRSAPTEQAVSKS